ncbi:MAG TPA: hypothetical protein VLA96_13910 [Terriglobales bacterium]|nr:hypothetical protein [Terriglobales bacterium]
MRRLIAIATLALALLPAAPALAQCSMCASNAAGASARTQKSLMHGVFVLLIPPLGLMAGLVGLAFFYRRDG